MHYERSSIHFNKKIGKLCKLIDDKCLSADVCIYLGVIDEFPNKGVRYSSISKRWCHSVVFSDGLVCYFDSSYYTPIFIDEHENGE
jgi:hypothetical protein